MPELHPLPNRGEQMNFKFENYVQLQETIRAAMPEIRIIGLSILMEALLKELLEYGYDFDEVIDSLANISRVRQMARTTKLLEESAYAARFEKGKI